VSDSAKITPIPDGPLQVAGAVPLSNSRSEVISTDEKLWLCRCGNSANKPYCDGTHKKIGFSSARESDRSGEKTARYEGKTLTILDNRSVCAHAGICTDRLATVFRMGQEPWIDPDGAAQAQVIDVINACPSGALSYELAGVLPTARGRAAGIAIAPDGPYKVVGAVSLVGDDKPHDGEHFTLCRCGASKSKPFCDGSHWSAGFKDSAS